MTSASLSQSLSADPAEQSLTCWTALNARVSSQKLDRALQQRVRRLAIYAQSMPCSSQPDRNLSVSSDDVQKFMLRVPPWQSESGADAVLIGQDWTHDSGVAVLMQQPASIDRAGLQRMILALSILSLDVYWHDSLESAQQASRLMRYWFIEPATRMHPNGQQAYAVDGAPPSLSVCAAPLFRDLWVLLDALRLLSRSSVMDHSELLAIRGWFSQILDWLSSGQQELLSMAVDGAILSSHHLLLLSVSVFLGRHDLVRQCIDRLPDLFSRQFADDGSPRHLVWLVPGRHGRLLNLQIWADLAVCYRALGFEITTLAADHGCGLHRVSDRLIEDVVASGAQPSAVIQEELGWLLLIAGMFGEAALQWKRPCRNDGHQLPDLMHPSYGVPPFWRLCQS